MTVSAPNSEGSVPLNWLFSIDLRAAAAARVLSTVLLPPPSVHGTSQRSTHSISSFVSVPISEASVPLNWLLSKFLRAAAAAPSAQSSCRLHSQSMAPHRGTHKYESFFVSAPSSDGSVPVNWLLSKFLRAAAAAKSEKNVLSTVLPPPSPSVHGTSQGHSQVRKLREFGQL
jgi:hypothetical protein